MRANQLTLPEFGAKIRAARVKQKISQLAFAAKIEAELARQHIADLKVSQTYIARLEQGLVVDPAPALLRALSTVLDPMNMNITELVGNLVYEKYKIPQWMNAPFFRRSKTLEELALWETETDGVPRTEVWIVTHKFVDAENKSFKEATCKILKNKGQMTFFMPEGPIGNFNLFRTEVLTDLDMSKDSEALSVVKLEVLEAALLTNGLVIVEPTSPEPQAFSIIYDGTGQPHSAISMTRDEIKSRIPALKARKLGKI
jgi:transcriptional regulator with XRE-family HTH domain